MTHCPPGNPKMTPRQAMGLWTTLAVAITLYVAFAWWALSRPVPFCKIEPPPFYQCTPKGEWNAPNCKCWDSK
jgi:hypothetical protein